MTCQLQFADDTRQAKEVARYKPLKKRIIRCRATILRRTISA
jgi:hypothetical protein